MYRNLIYRCDESATMPWNGEVILGTWDENGKRVTKVIPHQSHLYYVDGNSELTSDFTTITGKPLVRKDFQNVYQRNKWIKEHPRVKLYECLDPITEFLHEHFWEINQNLDFGQYPLRIYSWDIETAVSIGFPDCNNPINPLICFTFSDVSSNECWTWVLLAGDWKKGLTEKDFPSEDKKTYFVFESEREMYIHFLAWFKKHRPDLLTGWNISSFDVPYMINRMIELTSARQVAEAFSPVGAMRKKFVKPTVKSKGYDTYVFEGLTILDYLQLYRDKFCKDSMVIDFKLETVCQEELGVGKLQYDGSFKQFYLNDFKRFVEYNIIDVVRINDLERKKKLLALSRYMCNESLCTYDKILAAQPIVIGALDLMMKRQGQLTMSDDRVDPELKSRPFEGAYVYPVEPCTCGPFASFDLNSLYPNIIISVNISPETYVGKISGYDTDIWTVKLTDNPNPKEMSKAEFIKRFGNKVNVAPNGAMFLKPEIKEGICVKYEKYYYSGRKVTKKKMLEEEKKAELLLEQILEKDLNFDHKNPEVKLDTDLKKEWKKTKDLAKFYEIKQLAEKLNLNSLYGLFSSKYAPICLVEAAEAITSCGRVIIQGSMDFIDTLFNKKFPTDEKQKYVIFGDTDSVNYSSSITCVNPQTKEEQVLTIEDLFETGEGKYIDGDREFSFPIMETNTYNPFTSNIEQKPIQFIYRHKVQKDMYSVVSEDGEEVSMTCDHSLMVERNGELIEVKPTEIQEGDLLIINK